MPEVAVGNIIVGKRFRRDLGDIDALAKSISEIGLLQPIGLTKEGHLIFGARRLEACKRLGKKTVPCRYLDLEGLVQAEHDENVVRQDFLPSEKAAIAKALLTVEKKAAAERKKATQAQPGQRVGKHIGSENFSEPMSKGEALAKAASAVGWSRPTLAKATEVTDAAHENPEKFGDLVEKMDTTGKVNGAYEELKERQAEVAPAASKKKSRTSISNLPAITLSESLGADLHEITEAWDCSPVAAVKRLIEEKATAMREAAYSAEIQAGLSERARERTKERRAERQLGSLTTS